MRALERYSALLSAYSLTRSYSLKGLLIMRQRAYSFVTILLAMFTGTLTYAGVVYSGSETAQVATQATTPTTTEPTHYENFERTEDYIYTTAELTIVANPMPPQEVARKGLVWTCGAPVVLANDISQTVRTCEWR